MKNTKLFFHLFLVSILTIFVQNTTQAQLKAREGVTAKAFIGVNYHHVSTYTAREKGYPNKYGSYIASTIEGTNAKSAGILKGDYVIGINEYKVEQNFTVSDILKKYCPGDRVTLHIIRGNQERKDIEVNLVAYKLSNHMVEKPFLGVNYGILNDLEEKQGAIVGEIVAHSSAEEMGMQTNDIIRQINDIKLNSWNDLQEALQGLEVGEEVKIIFDRAGQTLEGITFIKNRANTYYHNCIPEEESKVETLDDEALITDPNSITLYPNPTNGTFTLTFKYPEEGKTSLRILDNRGQVIYKEETKINKEANFYKKDFDLSQYSKGIYFVQVNINGKEFFTKRVVLK